MSRLIIPIWKNIPAFRLLAPFATGIIIQNKLGIPYAWCISIILSCFLTTIVYTCLHWKFRNLLSLPFGIILMIMFMALGSMFTRQNTPIHTVNSPLNSIRDRDILQITLLEKTVKKIKTGKAVAVVNNIIRSKEVIPAIGKIIVYFKNNNPPGSGASLMINGSLQAINGSGNPGSFNYREYALRQGLTHQTFLTDTDYAVIDSLANNRFDRLLELSRDKIVAILRRYIPDEKNAGLAEALLIGYKNDLDKTLVSEYSNTGVVHIIAISGLHVGLIYILLLYSFKPFQYLPLLKHLVPVVILITLWLFTLLAGAQPSVLRSTIMFSFIVVGQLVARRSNVFNSLALSAFVLLCYNPFWLWDIGFQLSYAAVASILIFTRDINSTIFFNNRIVGMIWTLTAVTLAAQILTSPFCIYYFHQFPVYFLIANLIAVPFSGLILLCEILLCLISPFESLASLTGSLINEMIRLMNYCIDNIGRLPFALIQGLHINFAQAALLLVFLFCFSRWLLLKSIVNMRIAYLSLLGFLAIQLVSVYSASQQRLLVIYNIQSGTAIEFINGRISHLKADSATLTDIYIRDNIFKPCRSFYRIRKSTSHQMTESEDLYSFCGVRMLLITQPDKHIPLKLGVPIDILYIDSKKDIDIRTLISHFKIKCVVAGNRIKERDRISYQQIAADYGISFHSLSSKGAFVITLR